MYNSDIYNIISNYSTELNSKNFICAGSREDCWAKINLGAKQIAFGKTIDSATHITLLPNLKKIEKLNADKIKFIDEQSKIQKKINDIEIEIKDYTAIKRDYEKIEKKFTELTKPKEVTKDE